MDIELLWPLIQELVQSPNIAEEDWAFLKQNAETLGCSEAVLQAAVAARLSHDNPNIAQRVFALSDFVEALGAEATRKLPFLLEVAQYLALPVDLVQTLVQMPRTPALRFLTRLLKVIEPIGQKEALLPWVESYAKRLQLEPESVRYLLQLLEALQKKAVSYTLNNYWELLRLLDKRGMPVMEVGYLMDLAREARLPDAVTQGLQEFLRMRQKGHSALESLAYLVRTFIHKGILSEEELPFLADLAQQEGISQNILEGIIQVEKALRQTEPGRFGAEYLMPLLQALISNNALDETAYRLLTQRGNEVGISRPIIEAIADLEKQIFEKKAKFPHSLQPLIRVLVENARITDDRLIYLIKKAQEMGGTDKVVRSLVQIEIAAQKKALQERTTLLSQFSSPAPAPTPTTQTPPSPSQGEAAPPSSVSAPPPIQISPSSASLHSASPSSPAESQPPITQAPSAQGDKPASLRTPAPTITEPSASFLLRTSTFPQGGHFPKLTFDYHSMKVFSLRSEKDIIRRAEIFSKDGRTNWYALAEYGEREFVLIAKSKPEHRFEEVISWAVSPTGEVIAVKHRLQGTYRVYLNGEEGRPLDDISNLILSPNHKHLAYTARKGEEIFVFLDNIGMGPFTRVTNLTFRPNEENDLFFVYQVDKNRWQIRDYLNNTYGEPAPAIDLLTFSPDGKRMVYVVLKNRKFVLKENEKLSDPYDLISDIHFTENSAHIVFLVRKGMQIGITWDGELLHLAEGISGVTLSPDSRFVCYIAREKEQNFLYIQKKGFGPYEKVERPFITRVQPSVIYPVVLRGKHHIFINGEPEAGPFDSLSKFSGQGNSYAVIVRKGGEGQAVLRDGKLGALYSTADQIIWDNAGKNIAYIARRKGEWAGVVWNETESDQYDFVQYHTFDDEGKALLFFARRRDGWYAVLNDIPIPDSLCKEILTPPVYDQKTHAFVYLYRKGKDVYEGRITLK